MKQIVYVNNSASGRQESVVALKALKASGTSLETEESLSKPSYARQRLYLCFNFTKAKYPRASSKNGGQKLDIELP